MNFHAYARPRQYHSRDAFSLPCFQEPMTLLYPLDIPYKPPTTLLTHLQRFEVVNHASPHYPAPEREDVSAHKHREQTANGP